MVQAYKEYQLYGYQGGRTTYYRNAVSSGVRPSECLGCLACEGNCPQQIEITKYLKEVDAIYGSLE